MNYLLILLLLLWLNRKTHDKDIIMYGMPSCKYCVIAKQKLMKAGKWNRVKYININTENGNILFDKTGSKTVPFFVNINTNQTANEFVTVDELFEKLKA